MKEIATSTGALVARLLRGPRHLRDADFEVRVSHYSDWHPESAMRPSAPFDPPLLGVDLLTVTGSYGRDTRLSPMSLGGQMRTSESDPWWELEVPCVVEHLDPALVLSSLSDFEASLDTSGLLLRAKPRQAGIDEGACLTLFDAETWVGRVDPVWGILREVESTSRRRGGIRSVLEWERTPPTEALESSREPSLPDGGRDLWPVVLDGMLASAARWEDQSFVATLHVQYEALGVTMAVLLRPTAIERLGLGQNWAARSRCRLYADPGRASPHSLGEWATAAAPKPGTIFTCTEELRVEGPAWTARRFRRPGGTEEDPWVPPIDLSPRWLMARESSAIPHFREMLDPTLVLSSVEVDSMAEEGDEWVLRGRPRREDRSHGYYPAIVHPCGDLWTARVSKEWGSISECRTTLNGAALASYDLTVERRGPLRL